MKALILCLSLHTTPLVAQQLEIRFLNVGQGDAALLRESGKTALIDAGSAASLGSFRLDTIDLLVASHNHADHIGGMTGILSSAVARFYLDNGLPHSSATYNRTITAVRASGTQYLQPSARTINLGDARLHVLPPPGGQGQNNTSVGILVEYGEFRALFTGDSEAEELPYWLGTGAIPRVNVVKVAHHGSANGTSVDWIRATHPQVAVISVGTTNSYGHPSAAVVDAWEQAGARVYRTDRDGGVLILANTDGSFVVTTDRSDPKGIVEFRPYTQDSIAAPIATPVQVVSPSCCRMCSRGKACGKSCIARGCACDAKP